VYHETTRSRTYAATICTTFPERKALGGVPSADVTQRPCIPIAHLLALICLSGRTSDLGRGRLAIVGQLYDSKYLDKDPNHDELGCG
jgi:hypothetical protein